MKRTARKNSKTIPDKRPDNKMSAALSVNLRTLRKAKGWSQADLAERTGVHLTHVSRVELGIYMPSLEFVLKAARAFGVSVEQLLSTQEDGLKEVRIEDLEMSERLRMLERLEKRERDAVITVIDSMLTKHRIREFLDEKPTAG